MSLEIAQTIVVTEFELSRNIKYHEEGFCIQGTVEALYPGTKHKGKLENTTIKVKRPMLDGKLLNY